MVPALITKEVIGLALAGWMILTTPLPIIDEKGTLIHETPYSYTINVPSNDGTIDITIDKTNEFPEHDHYPIKSMLIHRKNGEDVSYNHWQQSLWLFKKQKLTYGEAIIIEKWRNRAKNGTINEYTNKAGDK